MAWLVNPVPEAARHHHPDGLAQAKHTDCHSFFCLWVFVFVLDFMIKSSGGGKTTQQKNKKEAGTLPGLMAVSNSMDYKLPSWRWLAGVYGRQNVSNDSFDANKISADKVLATTTKLAVSYFVGKENSKWRFQQLYYYWFPKLYNTHCVCVWM